MSEYARKSQSSRPSANGSEASEKSSSLGAKGKKIGAELDAVLDEIDSILEENAEEFVSSCGFVGDASHRGVTARPPAAQVSQPRVPQSGRASIVFTVQCNF